LQAVIAILHQLINVSPISVFQITPEHKQPMTAPRVHCAGAMNTGQE